MRTAHDLQIQRPWGHYDLFLCNQPGTVKLLSVEPGKRLSLQKHHHRSEYWYVVRGKAEVWSGTDVNKLEHKFLLEGNDIYIPVGFLHRLGNQEPGPLVVLEIISGKYDEQDIERFDDDYGRIEKK